MVFAVAVTNVVGQVSVLLPSMFQARLLLFIKREYLGTSRRNEPKNIESLIYLICYTVLQKFTLIVDGRI